MNWDEESVAARDRASTETDPMLKRALTAYAEVCRPTLTSIFSMADQSASAMHFMVALRRRLFEGDR